MQVIRDIQQQPVSAAQAPGGAVIALGNFDGVHLGHQAIIKTTRALADAANTKAAVMTFEPHPREFFTRGTDAPQRLRLTPLRTKLELLEAHGIDVVYVMRFNASFAAQTPQAFVRDVLYRQLAAAHVVSGENFAFGRGRAGDTAFMTQQAMAHGFGYTACAPVQDAQGRTVSSSAVRALLSEGKPQEAAALLGYAPLLQGRVRRGQQKGRQLGFPTANIRLPGLFIPRYGVYAVRFTVAGNSTVYNGVANLGVRPTISAGAEPLLEVHALDANLPLYGKRLRVELLTFIREEQHFMSLDALSGQIAQDTQAARQHLKGHAC